MILITRKKIFTNNGKKTFQPTIIYFNSFLTMIREFTKLKNVNTAAIKVEILRLKKCLTWFYFLKRTKMKICDLFCLDFTKYKLFYLIATYMYILLWVLLCKISCFYHNGNSFYHLSNDPIYLIGTTDTYLFCELTFL